MYKLVIVTSSETSYGFRLAGVEVKEANDLEEGHRQIVDLINDDSTGIIAVDENLIGAIDERLQAKIDKLYRPIVIPIPSKEKFQASLEREKYIRNLIKQAVGFDIKL